ncbi:Protocadherin Fat 1, partial [Stegodyphus mimosarum]
MPRIVFKIFLCALLFIVITAQENNSDTKSLKEKIFNIFNRNGNLAQASEGPGVNSTEIIGPDDPCHSQPCQNGGECKQDQKTLGAYKCECKSGYSGTNCEIECNCGEDSNCTYGYYGGKTCICKEGYGDKSGKCEKCDCGEGAFNCTFGYYGGKSCNCKDGYGEKGDKCEKCYCGQNAGCRFDKYDGKKTCFCLEGYRYIDGKCKDPCIPNPCQNGGNCKVEYVDYTCTCKFPYSGRNCEKDCGCDNGTCVEDQFGNAVCQCPPGFGLYLNNTCKACKCGGGASCEFNGSEAATIKTCLCKEGYQNIMNICKECYCGPSSSCFFENYDVKRCICPDGFMDINGLCKDPCNPNPCQNKGKCKFSNRNYSCDCVPPYSGRTCEMDCSCGPNGKCSLDIHGNKECYCRRGFVEFEGSCKEEKKRNIAFLTLLGIILATIFIGIILFTCVLWKKRK